MGMNSRTLVFVFFFILLVGFTEWTLKNEQNLSNKNILLIHEIQSLRNANNFLYKELENGKYK